MNVPIGIGSRVRGLLDRWVFDSLVPFEAPTFLTYCRAFVAREPEHVEAGDCCGGHNTSRELVLRCDRVAIEARLWVTFENGDQKLDTTSEYFRAETTHISFSPHYNT